MASDTTTPDGYAAKALSDAATRARLKGLPWNLYTPGNRESLNAAILRLLADPPLQCPVFPWLEMRYEASGTGRPLPETASLDRIKPELGYVWGNVRWISWRANSLRKDANADEMVALVDDLRNVKPSPEAYSPSLSEGPCIVPNV